MGAVDENLPAVYAFCTARLTAWPRRWTPEARRLRRVLELNTHHLRAIGPSVRAEAEIGRIAARVARHRDYAALGRGEGPAGASS